MEKYEQLTIQQTFWNIHKNTVEQNLKIIDSLSALKLSLDIYLLVLLFVGICSVLLIPLSKAG